jgi:hypothetical protein
MMSRKRHISVLFWSFTKSIYIMQKVKTNSQSEFKKNPVFGLVTLFAGFLLAWVCYRHSTVEYDAYLRGELRSVADAIVVSIIMALAAIGFLWTACVHLSPKRENAAK